ncbi:YbhB/YbcL family Raf kinase inhibitor-like protein [Turicibacter sp. H121]|uniref:YbhB/YbcL family Raf kinase inhibitor-like protein n=1 Tax=Turicibacter sp. H121 TaxID=1712675 RepID=UPI0007632C7C|nr:YbhB/YbcL family Raf kinase inhibitor-like protein [Turicibacter sp. H121]AMC08703.1 phosphatidylethanolamine-binding protein [Turicibacter sp. H121]MCU7199975.1 YbhB/YbcL family Raf kinase inhibitor-like protein [Turicibacter sp. H121]
MKLSSQGIVNGVIHDRYGKRGPMNEYEMPTVSLPLKIEDAPANTVSYALVLEDKDAFPVCGFSWIHWTAANITKTQLQENESQSATDFIQGVNSWISDGTPVEACNYYGGMAPPDAPHVYEIHVYALDTMLDLKQGFNYNELYHQMDGHILDQATLKGIYKN